MEGEREGRVGNGREVRKGDERSWLEREIKAEDED